MSAVERVYPNLQLDLTRDCFVVWVRWVAMEKPLSPEDPPAQGVRVELLLNRNSVLGPTIVYRRDLETPVYLRTQATRTAEVLRAAAQHNGIVDMTLIIHGSVANAPYAAVYVVRDYLGQAVDTQAIGGTPLLQFQPSTPGDQWHVAGQANLRIRVGLEGDPRRHLKVIRD